MTDDDAGQFFWTMGASGRLHVMRCQRCTHYFHPPSPRCPRCLANEVAPEPVLGTGLLYSYTLIPAGEGPPTIVAMIDLDDQDDLRLTSWLRGVEPEACRVGLRVRAAFEPDGVDVFVPVFEPAPVGETAP